MTLVLTYSLLILVTLWGAQIFKRPLLVWTKWALLIAVLGTLAHLSYLTALQYFIWKSSGPISALLLPPHAPLRYFITYAFTTFWVGPLLALAFGLLFFLLLRLANRRFGNQFFYEEEPILVLLCFVLVGHPVWIFYLGLVLATVLVLLLARALWRHDFSKVSLRYAWIPLAIVSLFTVPFLEEIGFGHLLGF